MDLLFFVIISFVLLVVSAIKGYFILTPLLASMAILIAILLRRGFPLKSLIEMAVAGSQQSFSVIGILLLIGAVMAVWMAAGTVPVLVYWGIKSIDPQYFIFWAFILTSVISVLLGTSFGTVSIIAGSAIALFVQGYSPIEILEFAIAGFKLESTSSLKDIVAGGGILSMAKVSLVVIVSTAFAGLFAGTRILEFVEVYLNKARSRGDLFLGTTVISIFSAAFGYTQTIAILLTHQLVESKYRQHKLDDTQLAVDLGNTAVVISPLIPWNIAGLVPATVLGVNSGFIPYAFYLYLIPLFNLIQMKWPQPIK